MEKNSLPKLKSKCLVCSAYGFIVVFKQTDFQVSSYCKNSSKWVNARFHFVFIPSYMVVKKFSIRRGRKITKLLGNLIFVKLLEYT